MSFAAVYDACVLYPFEVRDILMVAADTRTFRVHWSEQILEECVRNLVAAGKDEAGLRLMVRNMNLVFPDANVAEKEYGHLIPSMVCHDKDKHVLAVAVCRKADVIVTVNHRDFPEEGLRPHRVETQSPDHFVLNVIDLDDELFMEKFNRQYEQRVTSARRYGRPVLTAKGIAQRLNSERLRQSGQAMPAVSKEILRLLG